MEKRVFSLALVLLFTIFACAGQQRATHDRINSDAMDWLQKSHESASSGKFDETIEFSTKALDADPDLVNAYINRSWAYSEKGEYQMAIEDSNKALQLSPENALALNNRGLAFHRQYQIEKASEDYKKACDLGFEIGCANYKSVADLAPVPPVQAVAKKKDPVDRKVQETEKMKKDKPPVKTYTAKSERKYSSKKKVVVSQSKKKSMAGIPGKYPESSTRLLTDADVVGMGDDKLKIMRNEIYARHSYIFKTEEMQKHFSRQPWYTPLHSDVSSELSDTEKANVKYIKGYEKK